MITIVHGGQTGVDRGSHEAALGCGWKISGFMPKNGRDEYGLIPRGVAQYLQPCTKIGYPARTNANLEISSALLLVVENRADPSATPGSRLTWEGGRLKGLRRTVTDPTDSHVVIARWLHNATQAHFLATSQPFRLMVAGPRDSKWPEGRVETAAYLRRIKNALDALQQQPRTENP